MKLNVSCLLACLLAAAFASGCSTVSDGRKIDYKSTRTLPPLEVPPDLSAPPAEAGTGAAPPVTTYSEFATGQQKPVAGAEASTVLPQFQDLRIERDGALRYLVAKGEAEALWPKLREFVLANGLLVARESAATGVIETEWADNRANVGSSSQLLFAKWFGTLYSTGLRDRFRLRLDRGTTPGTVEVTIGHQGMEEVISRAGHGVEAEATRWQPRAPDTGLEIEMLRLLMVHLGSSEDAAKQAATAATGPAKAPERAQLKRGETGGAFLSLEEGIDRAWRRVGLTLDRFGFTVEDRDRSKGIYYIRYVDPDKKSKTAKEDQYQLLLKAADAGTRVEVLNREGQPDSSPSGERILGLLHEQLK